MDIKETSNGKGTITVEKFKVGEDKPYETITAYNIWLTTGWTELLKLATGASSDHWDSTNATIGVGTDATAASAAQTGLIATGVNTCYKGMVSGYPTTPSAGTFQLRAKFLATEANFTWAEMVAKNTASGVCWNRNATGWGTKANTEIWYATIQLGVA